MGTQNVEVGEVEVVVDVWDFPGWANRLDEAAPFQS